MSANDKHIILLKAQKGNRKAQKALYDLYRVYLFGVALLYANTKEEAEDILLEGFYRIFKDLKSYKHKGNLRAWMRKVMVNSALMHQRKYGRWSDVHKNAEEVLLNIPESIDFTMKERVQSIMSLIRSLPHPQRIIFSLKAIEGYSYKEISEQLNIKESTLRSHYLRARKNLQNVLQKELE